MPSALKCLRTLCFVVGVDRLTVKSGRGTGRIRRFECDE